ncbi:S8 family peptidase [Thermoflexus sp.]|uniref:S8 family peptidase n=1 Tax=Thermoflexus sp. TaxID=1969742 RepID=UPI002ADDEC50|nr:S8 family peptidase [Thermoflexus sp.]
MRRKKWPLFLGMIVLIGSFLGAPALDSSGTASVSAGPECFLPLEDGRCLPSPVPADAVPPPTGQPQVVSIPRRPGVVVKRKDAVAPGAFRSALVAAGFPNAEALAVPRWWRIPVPPGQDPERLAEQLRQHPAVEIAEVEREVRIAATPNDPYYGSYQWNLPRIRAPQAWDLITGTSSVVIAVIDTGVDYTHPDLSSSRIWLGYDFVNDDPDPMDDEGHGTHVAGIAGANTNNGIGIAGVCWRCDLLAVKVLNVLGRGWVTDVAAGIRYAVDWGAASGKRTIINLSLGGPSSSSVLADAVSYARSRGALLVAAAGNKNTSAPDYPAAYPGVIGVSATDSDDQRASFSNYGSYVDIAAPGEGILSTYPPSVLYLMMSGTSMAAPHVAGVAGLVWSRKLTLSPGEVCTLLLSTADDLGAPGRDDVYGYGRLDAFEAVWAAQPLAPPSPPGSYRLYLPLVVRSLNWIPVCP